ncbi:MAG: hypothetical protein QOE86_1087 [Solirubrobacteraceae bacterium]|nr:hypothetical protein [Solirubrobacteraceae bacterium]
MREIVPRPLLDRLRDGDRAGAFDAAAAWVDLAGFTETADALARHGDHGAEVLAGMVEAVFAPLLETVYGHGGFVSSFAGDAFMAIFPGERADAGPRALAAAHAVAASVAAQPAFRSPYGEHPVAVKVGAGAGTARWGVVSARDGSRASPYWSGDALAAAVEAELAAQPGDVVLHASLDGLDAAQAPAPRLPAPPAAPDPLARLFLPDELLEADLPSEFRPTVAAFVALEDVTGLEAVVHDVFDLQHRYGGRVDSIELGDKGCLLYLVWGAPVSYEGDGARALGLLLELHARHPGRLRSGASRGTAFTGFAGFALREEYVTYSSHVNLAARLMGSARAGELLVDRGLADAAGGGFALRALGPRRLKGIAEPVELHLLEGTAQADAAHGPLVGRAAEQEALADFLAPLAGGRGAGAVLVAGDAGIGKSRLVAAQRARFPGRWLRGAADPVWRRELHPLRRAAADFFGQSQHATAIANRERFEARLTPGLEPHRAFLAALADLPDPGPAYEQAPAEARFRGLLDAFTALLRAQLEHHPLVLQVDDLHWADPETLAFLPVLRQALADRPFALVLTSREPAAAADRTLELGPLDAPAIATLAATILGTAVAPDTVDWLAERTAGNPFFLEQILLHVHERGAAEPGADGLEIRAGDLVPPTVGEVVVARLDGLAPEVRRTVQTAAVLGGEFDLPALERMLDSPPAVVAEWCEAAGRRGIWHTARRDRRGRFQHALVRDAAYGMLLQVSRTRLHASAADVLEDLHRDRLEPQLHRLAHHHARGGHPDRAVDYERRAAQHALRLGAYREAAECADSGLELAGGLPAGSGRRAAELALSLALGAGRIVTDGQTAPATRAAYDRALALVDGVPESRETFQALFGLRTYYQFAGDHEASARTAERCLEIATRLGDADLLIQAHLMVGNARFWAGELEDAERELAAMRALLAPDRHGSHLAGFAQDPRFTAVIPGALGAWLRGDGAEARRLVDSALIDAEAVGHRFSEALVLQAAGFLACLEDRPPAARAAAERLVELARAEAFPVYVAIGSVQLGWALARLGDSARGLPMMTDTVAAMRARGIGIGQTLLGLLVADAALNAGDAALARSAAADAIDIAGRIGERVFLAELHRLAALAAADDGARTEHLERARELAHRQGAVAVAARLSDPATDGAR